MSELSRLEEMEELTNDANKVRRFEKEIKLAALRKYDDMHKEFIDLLISKSEVTTDQLMLIKKVFDYIKSRV